MINKEQYKRLWMFLSSLVELMLMTGLWGVVWYTRYSTQMDSPFFRRGHWLVLAIYAALLFAFTQIYGAYRIGFYKRSDVIFSASLSAAFVNAITYLQTCLLAKQFLSLWPMAVLMIVDVLCIVLWATASGRLYRKLYPPISC